MTEEQIENLYKIKDLCCEKIKFCHKVCFDCNNPCIEDKIVTLINEVLNDN